MATGLDPSADRLLTQKFGYASSQTFDEALRKTAEIKSAFAELPSETRSEFGNDPARWLDSMATPSPSPEEIVQPPATEAESPPEKPVESPESTE